MSNRGITFYTLGIEFIVSVAIGIVSNFLVNSKEIAFLIGIGVFFCIELIRIRISTVENQHNIEKVSAIVQSLSPADSFSELAVLYGLRFSSQLARGTIKVSKEQIWDFWRDCVSKTSARWSVITNTKAKDTWDLGWGATTALAIQKERIENGCAIERVFVIDSDDELNEIRSTMEQQQGIGISVSYVLARELLKNQNAKNAFNQLGTLDVGICDGLWVYRTHLDKRRNMLSASATRDQNTLRDAEFLIREATRISRELPAN